MAAAISDWSIRSGDSSIKISFSMTCTNEIETTDEIDVIDDLIMLQIKAEASKSEGNMKIGYSFSVSKHESAKSRKFKINLASELLSFYVTDVDVPDEWSEMRFMGWKDPFVEGELYCSLLSISVTVIEVQNETVISKLYGDTEFTDFNLATAEGSVPLHRACMAASSDVFRAMLTNEWKETTEGQINMKGVTVQTLKHLKDYMYLGTVPNIGLRPLLLVARQYLIEDLEKRCIQKLSEKVSGDELFSLVQFACDNNIPELVCALLVTTEDSAVTDAYALQKEKKGQVEKQE